MTEVKLKVNLIMDGNFYPFGTVIERSRVPKHLRTRENFEAASAESEVPEEPPEEQVGSTDWQPPPDEQQ